MKDRVLTQEVSLCAICGAFVLVGAQNPCPCGFYGDPTRDCTCSNQAITRYQKRISGPLLDRIDIHVEVPRVEYDKLADDRKGEPSAAIRARVEAARQRQRERLASANLACNADTTALRRRMCGPG